MAIDNTLISAILVILIGLVAWIVIIWTNSRAAHERTHLILQQHHLVATNQAAHRLSQAVHLLHPNVRLGIDYSICCDKSVDEPYISQWNAGGSMPTKSDLDDAFTRVPEVDSRGYADMRRAEYPSVEDQLDAAFKARHGDVTEQEELDKIIEQIKSKYPKTEDDL
jgi:hypothetical protein